MVFWKKSVWFNKRKFIKQISKYIICVVVLSVPFLVKINMEFGNVGFWGDGKTEVPWEKPESKGEQ